MAISVVEDKPEKSLRAMSRCPFFGAFPGYDGDRSRRSEPKMNPTAASANRFATHSAIPGADAPKAAVNPDGALWTVISL